MDETFREINDATKRILEVNGFDVEKPLRQGCCGALHDHAGDREYAKKLARNNVDALEDGSETPIIVNAAGCGAMLKEYGDLLEDEVEYAERAKTFSSRIQDVTEFLAKQELVPGAVLPYRVTYDAPCHMYHAQKIQTEPLKMLEAIPRLDFVPLKDSERCCGSGGIYNLTHPEIADEILSPKLDEIEKTGASVVLTANPGCHMQILAGLRMRGINNIEVRHIIDLLDESYQAAGFYG